MTVALFPAIAQGQSKPRVAPEITARLLSVAPKIDGEINEDEWKEADTLTNFSDGQTGSTTIDQTTVRLGYTAESIFVAFIANESDPSKIIGREVTPGAEFSGEDFFQVWINPFGTHGFSGRSRFNVNVLNTQNEEISGGRAAKREWRGIWKSSVKLTAHGWQGEIEIPWKMLNYPEGKNRTMDINFGRFQNRTQIFSRWADLTAQELSELNGRWNGLTPPKPTFDRAEFLAYVAPEYDKKESGVRSGLDARYRFTPTMTGLVSLNPDFRNIENQIAGVGFTRTERFVGEARPFFREGSGFFSVGDFPFGFGRMFYSNRIENFDVGAKVFGRVNPKLSIGALATMDTGNATASIVNISADPGARGASNIYMTSLDEPGQTNQTIGGSAYSRRGYFSFSGGFALARKGAERFASAGTAELSYEASNWFSTVKYSYIRPDFQPKLAFVPWTDRRGLYTYTQHSRELRAGPIRDFSTNLFAEYYEDYRGRVQQKGVEYSLNATTRSDISLGLSASEARFYGARDASLSSRVTFNSSNRYKRFGFSHDTGVRGGKPAQFDSVFGSFRILKKLDLGLSQDLFVGQGSERQTIATASYEISPTQSVSGRSVIYNGSSNYYLAYRNGGGTGTEFYVIVGDPNAEKFVSRLSVKLVFSF